MDGSHYSRYRGNPVKNSADAKPKKPTLDPDSIEGLMAAAKARGEKERAERAAKRKLEAMEAEKKGACPLQQRSHGKPGTARFSLLLSLVVWLHALPGSRCHAPVTRFSLVPCT
jgi:hypothetical protein